MRNYFVVFKNKVYNCILPELLSPCTSRCPIKWLQSNTARVSRLKRTVNALICSFVPLLNIKNKNVIFSLFHIEFIYTCLYVIYFYRTLKRLTNQEHDKRCGDETECKDNKHGLEECDSHSHIRDLQK